VSIGHARHHEAADLLGAGVGRASVISSIARIDLPAAPLSSAAGAAGRSIRAMEPSSPTLIRAPRTQPWGSRADSN
jgi:hypothetical protein